MICNGGKEDKLIFLKEYNDDKLHMISLFFVIKVLHGFQCSGCMML